MEETAETTDSQVSDQWKQECGKWLMIIGMPFLLLFMTGYHAGMIDLHIPVRKESNALSTNKRVDQACIDGFVYDNENAPIYQGSAKKDAKKVRNYVRPILEKKGYEQYTDILVAICYVESTFGKGDNANWMQVKNYSGDSGITSVKAGVNHFINLIEDYAIPENCTDINVLIQSYNYGHGYLTYCLENGGKDTETLRKQFQEKQGGNYGNSQYVTLVQAQIKKQKLNKASKESKTQKKSSAYHEANNI